MLSQPKIEFNLDRANRICELNGIDLDPAYGQDIGKFYEIKTKLENLDGTEKVEVAKKELGGVLNIAGYLLEVNPGCVNQAVQLVESFTQLSYGLWLLEQLALPEHVKSIYGLLYRIEELRYECRQKSQEYEARVQQAAFVLSLADDTSYLDGLKEDLKTIEGELEKAETVFEQQCNHAGISKKKGIA